jgi:crotonobetainyl-CoA:carnitine CoA-transferase CaiB-like acyl-CoA transferase
MSVPVDPPNMNERITSVTAYTTLDFVEGAAVGPGWTETGAGVLNVSSPDDDPTRVELQFELDGVDLDRLPHHADRVDLTPEQARTVASELVREADRIEGERDD